MNLKKVIVALDFPNKKEALKIVDNLDDLIDFYKVGLELFINEGPSIIDILKKKGKRVFLDLKFHDIPNTVSKAVRATLKYGVDMLTLHASSGIDALKRSVEIVNEFSTDHRIKIIGVTLLTSLDNDELKEIYGFPIEASLLVKNLALLSKKAGLDGVVASAREISIIKENCGKDFLVVTPGVRLKKLLKDDQKRTVNPKEAINLGADYIVIGRAITNAENPIDVLLELE